MKEKLSMVFGRKPLPTIIPKKNTHPRIKKRLIDNTKRKLKEN
jgi:hypothetical protein